jgi:DNA-binding transcriptional MocR family regulator
MIQPSPFAVAFRELGPPRYQQLAEGIERAVRDGRLQPGDRLPPLRQLADDLHVSVTTVAAAFNLLSERKLIRAEVGRGTFVSRPEPADVSNFSPISSVGATAPLIRAAAAPWRRRALMMAGARLRARYPNALDCSTGRPDVALLPLEVLRRAWRAAVSDTSTADLQYAGPDVVDALVQPLIELLAETGGDRENGIQEMG